MSRHFSRLVRFKDSRGAIRYGEPQTSNDLIGQTVTVYDGDSPWSCTRTQEQAEIAEVLSPLASVPLIYGVGLNYKKHIEEAGFPVPKFPVIFTKPNDSLAGPYEDVPINAKCLNMDYEGELCVIIGEDVLNFSRGDDPLKYVLGFAVGNDVSSRYWQAPDRSGSQHGMGKSFDKFAPLGPVIVGSQCPDIQGVLQDGLPNVVLRTSINGEVRQEENTSDLLFRMTDLLEFLSLGRTVRKGTVIMTGTPSGVAAFMKPPQWLKNGDIVEVHIDHLGAIRNKMVIE